MTDARCTGWRAGLLLALAGCEGGQSAFTAAGPQSARIETLFWAMTAIAAVVCLAVYAAFAFAARAGSRRREMPGHHHAEQQVKKPVVVAVGATVVILLAFLGTSYATGRPMTAPPRDDGPLTIRITGYQWWWDVTYKDPEPSRMLNTANEIHVPVGRPVLLELTSRDVIHSFWAPNLAGKRDLVPGYRTSLWFRADTPGVYRSQCAEFCGHQHAKMAMLIVAEPPEKFAAWYEHQLTPHAPPADSVEQRGHEVFMKGSCILCHTIAGTPAGGRTGPNLSHLASRTTIAAGTLPNTRGHLAGWIVDPQGIKPGVKMPSNQLSAGDLQALLTYLERLR